MSRSSVRVHDYTARITLAIEQQAIVALNHAAQVAAVEADRVANHPKKIATYTAAPARNIGSGYESAIKSGPLTNIFDKGTFGQHKGALKRPRKPAWQVNRGTNPYIAHRSNDLAGKGIAARGIRAAARKAGRAALIARLRSR